MWVTLFYGYYEDWLLEHKVVFDGPNKLIYIADSANSIDIRTELYSAWKEWSLIRDNFKYEQAMRSVGGDPLPGGNFLGSTFFLTNGWRIVLTHGVDFTGNIFTDEGDNPFIVNEGVQLSTSTVSNLVDTVSFDIDSIPQDPTTISLLEGINSGLTTVRDLIQSQDPDLNKNSGIVVYWDPLGGSDADDGLTRDTAVFTFQRAHDLVSNGRHDTILAVHNSALPEMINDRITITKNFVTVRAIIPNFELFPNSGVPITISGNGCEITGFNIVSPSINSDCINITGDDSSILSNNITNGRHGINADGVRNIRIQGNRSDNQNNLSVRINYDSSVSIKNGVRIGYNRISNSVYGIDLVSTPNLIHGFTFIERNIINNCSSSGIRIGENVGWTLVKFDNTLYANGGSTPQLNALQAAGIQSISDSGNIDDGGHETEIESISATFELSDETLNEIRDVIESAITDSIGDINFDELLNEIKELLKNVGISNDDIKLIVDAVVQNIQQLNIVGIKERVVLGPCEQPEKETPKARQKTEKAVPKVLPRSLKNVPKMIKKPPLMDND